MEYNENNTEICSEILAEEGMSIEELHEIIEPITKTQSQLWKEKITMILQETGYSNRQFAKLCGRSHQIVTNWCKGEIPRTREMFMRIGIVAGYDIDGVNNLLLRYGRYPKLRAKILEDSACMFVLNTMKDDDVENKMMAFDEILSRVKQRVIAPAENNVNISTTTFNSKLLKVKTVLELEDFIDKNIDVYCAAYKKVATQMLLYIWNQDDWQRDFIRRKNDSIHTVAKLAGDFNWTNTFTKNIYGIVHGSIYPTRDNLITFGIFLGLSLEDMNDLLMDARMEPLYSKNCFESVVIYILQSAYIKISPEGSDLYGYTTFYQEEQIEYAKEVLSEFDMPEARSLLKELMGKEEKK